MPELRSLILAALAVASLACSRPPTQNPDEALREADIGLAQAIAVARDLIPHGAVLDAEFEVGRRGPVYEVELLYGAAVYEVYVDPNSGEVVYYENEFGDEELDEARAAFEHLERAEASFAEAIAAAERELGGTAFEAEIGAQGYVVAVLTEQGPYQAILDSHDAAILGTSEIAHGPEIETEADLDDPAVDEDDLY